MPNYTNYYVGSIVESDDNKSDLIYIVLEDRLATRV
jgi:hypothetical protein